MSEEVEGALISVCVWITEEGEIGGRGGGVGSDLSEGLWIVGAGDEGGHGKEALLKDAVVCVVLGRVLTQVL